jgi:hypothetical protein
LYRATYTNVKVAGKIPTGNFIHAVLAPYTYAGAPTGLATAMPVPPISVTWFPTPDRSIHCEPVHESAL